MELTNHILPPGLTSYIEAIFHYKGFKPTHSIERIVPTGHAFLIFELDNMTRHVFNNQTLKPQQTFTKCWLSGTHRKYISISAHPNSEMLVIQFRHGAAYPFIHISGEYIAEKVIPETNILNGALEHLRDDIYNTESVPDKFALVEKWLIQQFDETKVPPPSFYSFIKLLQEEPATSLQQLAKGYPYSQKQLIQHFKKYVGISPKYFQRIFKFQQILLQIHKKETIKWTDVAYQCGYSDQAHFIREFKHFSGFNPVEFISKNRQEEINFFPLDQKG